MNSFIRILRTTHVAIPAQEVVPVVKSIGCEDLTTCLYISRSHQTNLVLLHRLDFSIPLQAFNVREISVFPVLFVLLRVVLVRLIFHNVICLSHGRTTQNAVFRIDIDHFVLSRVIFVIAVFAFDDYTPILTNDLSLANWFRRK